MRIDTEKGRFAKFIEKEAGGPQIDDSILKASEKPLVGQFELEDCLKDIKDVTEIDDEKVLVALKGIANSLGIFGSAALPLLKVKKEMRDLAKKIRKFMQEPDNSAKAHDKLVT